MSLLDGVESCDALERLAGDRRGSGGGEFVEAAADMGPAEGELHLAALGEGAIAAIAVDLQDALEAGEMSDRPLGLAVGRVDIGDAGRVGAAPRAIIAGIGPELAGLGASAAGIEHRRRGLVGEQFGRALQRREQALMHRPQQEGGTADPIGQGRAVELDALPGVNLRLAVQRKVIGIFGDQHLRDRRLGRQSALDQSRRRGRLHHHVLAGPAGILGPANDQDPELRRHDVEPLARILADPMQRVAAARTGMVVDVDHHLDARQVRGKRSPVHAAFGGSICLLGRIGRIALGLAARFDLLDVFEPEQHLIFGQRLGAAAEAMALQFFDDLDEAARCATRSAISIAFSVPGSSGSHPSSTVMAGLDHAPRCVASVSGALIHCAADHPGCIGAGVSRAA